MATVKANPLWYDLRIAAAGSFTGTAMWAAALGEWWAAISWLGLGAAAFFLTRAAKSA
jgi:hypothetical protein